jgi:hypothetical protein
MFEEILTIISNYNSFDNTNKIQQPTCDPSLMSKLSDKKIGKIFYDITGQDNFNVLSHDMFTYDDNTKNIYETGQNINFVTSNGCPIIFEEMEESIIISILPDEELINYLYENIKCNYIGFPIYTHHYKLHVAHISLLLFDNINKKCYYIDSNGKTDKDRYFYDSFFNGKIEFLQNFGLEYNYEKSDIWNKNNIVLNYNYRHNELNNDGNCVIWTILILHLISLLCISPQELYEKLDVCDPEEKIFMLKEYLNIMTMKYTDKN